MQVTLVLSPGQVSKDKAAATESFALFCPSFPFHVIGLFEVVLYVSIFVKLEEKEEPLKQISLRKHR